MVVRWNGTAWFPQNSPDPGTGNLLLGVAAAGAKHAWAVGESRQPHLTPLISRWNGTVWK